MAGVSVRGSARATLTGNRITDGRASGVHVSEAATAEAVGNTVWGNQLCGLELDGHNATLVARRNDLRGNGGESLSLAEPGMIGEAPPPLLEDNLVGKAKEAEGCGGGPEEGGHKVPRQLLQEQ